jgi:hypothetical protein
MASGHVNRVVHASTFLPITSLLGNDLSYRFVATRHGSSGKELEHLLGATYKTAHSSNRWAKRHLGSRAGRRRALCEHGSGGRLDWDALCVARAVRADDQQR